MKYITKNFTLTPTFAALKKILDRPLTRLQDLRNRENRQNYVSTERYLFDYRLTHLQPSVRILFEKILDELDFNAQRDDLFSGRPINVTEKRAALHPVLRADYENPHFDFPLEALEYVHTSDVTIKSLSRKFQNGEWKGVTGKTLDTFVNIGIGGSYLGPKAVIELLKHPGLPSYRFLSNADDVHVRDILESIDPERSLFAIVSKSFTTSETLQNARVIKELLTERLGKDAVKHHMLAVTAAPDKALEFGISPHHILEMRPWIGGRFSVWSPAGLAVPFVLGYSVFDALKQGAREADIHFLHRPPEKNIPIIWAFIHVFYALTLSSDEVYVPYRERMEFLVDHFRQLTMESNGKSVQRDGKPVTYPTAGGVWGGTGTNVQHSFFQYLHQGTSVKPVYFLGSIGDETPFADNRKILLANLWAQGEALATGKDDPLPFSRFPGNRPSLRFLFDKTDAFNVGFLMATLEHKIFTESVLWNINAFDQPGVELGKTLARKTLEKLETGGVRQTDDPALRFIFRHLP